MPIESVPDHVAVAVPDIDAAAARWRDHLGGGWQAPVMRSEEAGFASRQLRYAGGAKLELLEPVGDGGFATRFLQRFGARIHHVTLKVPALLPAVEQLRDEGFDVVDVFAEGEMWHEAFLRPSQVGGLIVQIAWAGHSDEEFAALFDTTPEAPAADAATLLGPSLMHPDLSTAASVWSTLGAEVTETNGGLDVTWRDAPLTVRIDPGDPASAVGVRFAEHEPLDQDPTLGAATLPA